MTGHAPREKRREQPRELIDHPIDPLDIRRSVRPDGANRPHITRPLKVFGSGVTDAITERPMIAAAKPWSGFGGVR